MAGETVKIIETENPIELSEERLATKEGEFVRVIRFASDVDVRGFVPAGSELVGEASKESATFRFNGELVYYTTSTKKVSKVAGKKLVSLEQSIGDAISREQTTGNENLQKTLAEYRADGKTKTQLARDIIAQTYSDPAQAAAARAGREHHRHGF